MDRRLIVFLCLSLLVAVYLTIPVQAWSNRGRLEILVEEEEGVLPYGEVMIYQVAKPSGRDYLLGEAFGGGLVKREDAHSSALAAWLSELVPGNGLSRILDADGRACYTDLPEGLYLILQSEYREEVGAFSPVLVAIPSEGSWKVGVIPETGKVLTESPDTGQHFSPLFGAMVIVLCVMGLGMCIEKIRRK